MFSQPSSTVSTEALRRKLGARAFFTWAVLLPLRNKQGVTHASIRALLSRCHSLRSKENVRGALRRLREAGLLENLGRRTVHIGGRSPRCFARTVRGKIVGDLSIVPEATSTWLSHTSGWGGARNVPRRTKAKLLLCDALNGVDQGWSCNLPVGEFFVSIAHELRKVAVEIDGWNHKYDPKTRARDEAKERFLSSVGWQVFRVTNAQVGTDVSACARSVFGVSSVTHLRGGFGVSRAPLEYVASSTQSNIVGVPSEHPRAPREAEAAVRMEASLEPDIGVVTGGTTLPDRGIPLEVPGFPYPSIELIQPAYVPSPPLIGDLSDREKVDLLVRTYNRVASQRYRKERTSVLARPPREDPSVDKALVELGLAEPKKKKKKRKPRTRNDAIKELVKKRSNAALTKKLLEAAALLVENRIPPSSWAAFSIDTWREYMPERQASCPPGLRWVWSTKRIRERLDWFSSEECWYTGRTVYFGSKFRALLHRYTAMSDEVARVWPCDLKEVTERYFPDDRYQHMMEAARAEAKEDQERLDAAAASGEWLWL